MKEILRTNDPSLIAFASAMLKGEGVAFFVLDQNMSIMEGSTGAIPTRMMVAGQDAFRANAILKDNDIETGLSA